MRTTVAIRYTTGKDIVVWICDGCTQKEMWRKAEEEQT